MFTYWYFVLLLCFGFVVILGLIVWVGCGLVEFVVWCWLFVLVLIVTLAFEFALFVCQGCV